MLEMGKYYLCKKCKEVNNEELNSFIYKVFYTDYKSMNSRTSPYGSSYNYYDFYNTPQETMKFRVGCIYQCMMDNYLKDENGNFVYMGTLDGFLFEEVKFNLDGCEKIITAIRKHQGCFASVEPFRCIDGQHIVYICRVELRSVNGYHFVSEMTFSQDPVSGLLAAYRNSRKKLVQCGKLKSAIYGQEYYFYKPTYNYERI